MIENRCFTASWIEQKRREIGRVDPALLEKTIYAMALLCGLARSKMPFVFKGGTSLILLIKDFRRLSIDVDIVADIPRSEYEVILEEIGKTAPFLGYVEDKRGDRGLPRRTHFKFAYHSVVSKRKDYVLLDILEEKNIYPTTKMVAIEPSFVEVSRRVSVRMPTAECLLGDKLTAFAPNTIGVPYERKSGMQIIKHLFDIGELFGVAEDMNMVRRAYEAIARAEIGYRENAFILEEALTDTFNTGVKVCMMGMRGERAGREAEVLRKGIQRVESHLVNTLFTLTEARLAASRAILLSALVREKTDRRGLGAFRWKPQDDGGLGSLSLNGELERLNRIKLISPEAFHNLHTAQGFLVEKI
ncbi:MAG: nucleotidyl transferase AbiEii/AbiGii toxin family protein [Candidatus Omnitrophota bacterium]